MQLRILVVDDEEIMGDMMRELLTKRNHSSEHVFTAGEAIERARYSKYDLIIMDNNIKGSALTGLQATQEIRKYRSTPIYMCSSDTIAEAELKAAGADGFLPKEFPLLKKSLDALLAQLQKQEAPEHKPEIPSYLRKPEYQDPLDRISGPSPLDAISGPEPLDRPMRFL
jgi:CheY-like chemotaxis protein